MEALWSGETKRTRPYHDVRKGAGTEWTAHAGFGRGDAKGGKLVSPWNPNRIRTNHQAAPAILCLRGKVPQHVFANTSGPPNGDLSPLAWKRPSLEGGPRLLRENEILPRGAGNSLVLVSLLKLTLRPRVPAYESRRLAGIAEPCCAST